MEADHLREGQRRKQADNQAVQDGRRQSSRILSVSEVG
jgi:hypothetical protein